MEITKILFWQISATASVLNTITNQPLSRGNVQNCIIIAAVPKQIKFMDYVNNNCINGKLKINQPFGLHNSENGFIKWEDGTGKGTAIRTVINTSLPHVENSLELRVWRNCSWKYVVTQLAGRLGRIKQDNPN